MSFIRITLTELYQEAIGNQSLWNYYHGFRNSDFASLNNTSCCKDFIINYMNRGGKADMSICQEIDNLKPTRIKHIVSCFFIGLGIYRNVKCIQQQINQSVISRNPEQQEQHFSYLWFLTVLFHDIGYVVEENKNKTHKKEEHGEYLNLIKNLGRKPKHIPKVFTKAVLRNYLRWRMCSHSCFDHGIVGGIKLYKCLTEFRRQKVDNLNLASTQFTDENNLYWGPELDADFNFISWVVACHNIWFTNHDKPEARQYHCCKLDKLIIGKEEYKISATEHPFLFLFLLADSIEPIKRLEGTEWLDQINISFTDNGIKIDLSRLPESEKKKKSLIP